MPIRVYCVDDHPLIIKGLTADLADAASIELVGSSTNPLLAVEEIAAKRDGIDVVLSDIEMPGMTGLELCTAVKAGGESPRVVFLTYNMSDETRAKVLLSPVDALLYKSASAEEIVRTIEDVIERGRVIVAPRPSNTPRVVAAPLTKTELVVLRGIACRCLSSAEIAEELHRSRETVETHRKNIMQKLDCHNVAELVHYAMALGICSER